MTKWSDMEIEIKIDPAVQERLNKNMADAAELLTKVAGNAGLSMQKLGDMFVANMPPLASMHTYATFLAQERQRFEVGDGQMEIVTDPAAIGWNNAMQGLAEVGEKVAQFDRDMEQDKIKARQRVKDDVGRKRKEVMRRKKL